MDLLEELKKSCACKMCRGTGLVRAMQMVKLPTGDTARGPDTLVTCPSCGGTGVVLFGLY